MIGKSTFDLRSQLISMVQAIDVAAVPVAEDLYGICSTLIIGQLPGTGQNRHT
jgi:hypothetical protein